jgi:ribonuclease HI
MKTYNSKIYAKIYPEETKLTENYEFEYIMNFDGCSKGNPGRAGAGAVIYKNGIEIWGDCQFVGINATNNVAEYAGLVLGLEQATEENITRLLIQGDSLLVIKQMTGEYKVHGYNLIPFYNRAMVLLKQFEIVSFQHVYREKNVRADELSNRGLLLEML